MTLENSKRLYNHYIEKGLIVYAEDILKKHPELKEPVQEEKPIIKKKVKKSN